MKIEKKTVGGRGNESGRGGRRAEEEAHKHQIGHKKAKIVIGTVVFLSLVRAQ